MCPECLQAQFRSSSDRGSSDIRSCSVTWQDAIHRDIPLKNGYKDIAHVTVTLRQYASANVSKQFLNIRFESQLRRQDIMHVAISNVKHVCLTCRVGLLC